MRQALLAAALIVAWTAAHGGAAAIAPKYTATDLGSANLVLAASGFAGANLSNQGDLVAANAMTYAFPHTSTRATPTQLGSVPLPAATDPEPYWYSYVDTQAGVINTSGELVGRNFFGIGGHSIGGTAAVLSHQQADGSFSTAQQLWSSSSNLYNDNVWATPIDINKQGLILGQKGTSTNPGDWLSPIVLINAHDVAQYPQFSDDPALITLPTQIAGWTLRAPVALDDQGRILVVGYNDTTPQDQLNALLLTPDGVSSDPIPTPEPGTWAVLGLGMAGFWLRSRRRAS